MDAPPRTPLHRTDRVRRRAAASALCLASCSFAHADPRGLEATAPAPAVGVDDAEPWRGPFEAPALRDPLRLTAPSVSAWPDAQTPGGRWVRLKHGARVRIGAYGYAADQAVLRLTPPAEAPEGVLRIDALLLGARPLQNTPGATAEAAALTLSAATRGGVRLETALLERLDAPPDAPEIAQASVRFEARRVAQQRRVAPETTASLETDAQRARRLAGRAAIDDASSRLAIETLRKTDPRAFADALRSTQDPEATAIAEAPADPSVIVPQTDASAAGDPAQGAVHAEVLSPSVLPRRGALFVGGGDFAYRMGDNGEPDSLMLFGPVRMGFVDPATGRNVTLQAERMVMFLRNRDDDGPATVTPGDVRAQDLAGVYLENDAIISDGQMTVRAAQAYYDLDADRAVLLDAVLHTWEPDRGVPLYLRAAVLRQASADRFLADDARLTTSEFAVPHVSIGAGEVEVRRAEVAGGPGLEFEASNLVARLGDTPVLWLPYAAGRGRDVPLRRISVGYSSDDGVEVRTRWDALGLVGAAPIEGVDVELDLDYRGESGVGLGHRFAYERALVQGEWESYLLPSDSGEDDIGGRNDIDQDGSTRGFTVWRHRQALPGDVDFLANVGYASDPTFLEEFFSTRAYEDAPYQIAGALVRRRDTWTASLEAAFQPTDFTPQVAPLSAPGFVVDRLPEATVAAFALPGLEDLGLTLLSEARIGYLQARFGDDTPAERGFSARGASEVFGFANPNASFREAADAQGFPTQAVARLDVRQEVRAPIDLGPVDFTPFAVGRFTGYDDGFERFNQGADDDPIRFWGQVGARASSELAGAPVAMRDKVLDIDGLRHVVTPEVSASLAGATVDPEDLPAYDEEVESLADGGTVAVGLTNTWETKRGRPGAQRIVEWLMLRVQAVVQSEDAPDGADAPVGRFVDYRPELARGDDHLQAEGRWAVTQSLGVSGDATQSLVTGELERWRVGMQLDHGNRLRAGLDYTELDELDAQLLTYGGSYQLTDKYRVIGRQRLDFSANESRNLTVTLERKLPRWRLQLTAGFDQLDDEQTVGLVLIPDGLRGGVGNPNLLGSR